MNPTPPVLELVATVISPDRTPAAEPADDVSAPTLGHHLISAGLQARGIGARPQKPRPQPPASLNPRPAQTDQ
jgi:hypothetical protein